MTQTAIMANLVVHVGVGASDHIVRAVQVCIGFDTALARDRVSPLRYGPGDAAKCAGLHRQRRCHISWFRMQFEQPDLPMGNLCKA